MEAELKEMLDDLESLGRSLPDPSRNASIDKVLTFSLASSACVRDLRFSHSRAQPRLRYASRARFFRYSCPVVGC